MTERYIPELFRAQEENIKLNRELRQERAEHHAFRIATVKEKTLAANAADCDLPMVEGMIDGGEPRVVDGKVVISFGPDKSMTGTLDDAFQFWRSKPESFGNIIGIEKPKEPNAMEKHAAKLKKMTDSQFREYRKRRGPDYMTPESE